MPQTIHEDAPSIAIAANILRNQGVIVFPTDTAYGLGVSGCDALAVEKIFDIKGRSHLSPISIAVADIAMAQRYGEFSPRALLIAEKFLPGPLTIVVPARERLPRELLAGGTTIGFRIPDRLWLIELIRECNFPITATSANKSGDPALYTIPEIEANLAETWSKIDAVVDGGDLPSQAVSTVVECIENSVRILREGPISGAELEKVLG